MLRFFSHLSLRSKFLVVFLLLTLVPLCIQAYRDISASLEVMRERSNQALSAAAHQTSDRVDQFFRSTLNASRAASHVPVWREYLALPAETRAQSDSAERARETLHALLHYDELYITSAALLDAQGRNVLDTFPPDIGADESSMEHFTRARDLRRPYYSPVVFPSESGQAVIYFSHPILDEKDAVAGVLRFRFSSAVLHYLVSSAQGLAGEQSLPVLLDENFVRLAQPNAPKLTFRPVVPLPAGRREALRKAGRFPHLGGEATDLPQFAAGIGLAGTDSPYFETELAVTGAELYGAAVVRMHSQPWYVVFVQPREVLLAPIRRRALISIGTVILTMALAALAAAIFAGLLTLPISHLTSATAQMVTANLDRPIDTSRGDELGQLARTFVRMRQAVRSMLEELRTEVDLRRDAETALRDKNVELTTEVSERRAAQEELAQHRDHLEEMVRERTARLEAAQEELVRSERLAVLGQLTGTVAHELRNPLGTVRASLFVLAGSLKGEDPRVERALERIERNIVRCDQIIEELLDFTRSGELKKHPVAVDVWLRDLLEEMPRPDSIRLETYLESGATIQADSERLRRCFANVLSNACEAMLDASVHDTSRVDPDHPGGELTVTTRQRNGRLEIEVADSGEGISEENMARIFEPLYSSKSFGVGLGLPTVRRVMEQHGGGVEIDSEVGRGTRVTLWMPLEDGDQ